LFSPVVGALKKRRIDVWVLLSIAEIWGRV
jgi:hypothetical protein